MGDLVEVTLNGNLVSWTNDYAGPSETFDPMPSMARKYAPEKAPATPTSSSHNHGASKIANQPIQSYSADQKVAFIGNDWKREAFYNADDNISNGFTFLNHFGGSKDIPGTAAGGPA